MIDELYNIIIDYGFENVIIQENRVLFENGEYLISIKENGEYHIESWESIYNDNGTYDDVLEYLEIISGEL